MQNFIHACKRQFRLWRLRRDINRIHRQALRKARTSYEAIPLRDPDSFRNLLDLRRQQDDLCRASLKHGGEART